MKEISKSLSDVVVTNGSKALSERIIEEIAKKGIRTFAVKFPKKKADTSFINANWKVNGGDFSGCLLYTKKDDRMYMVFSDRRVKDAVVQTIMDLDVNAEYTYFDGKNIWRAEYINGIYEKSEKKNSVKQNKYTVALCFN